MVDLDQDDWHIMLVSIFHILSQKEWFKETHSILEVIGVNGPKEHGDPMIRILEITMIINFEENSQDCC